MARRSPLLLSAACSWSSQDSSCATAVAVVQFFLMLLLLQHAAAANSSEPTISYRSHYPLDSERPNNCAVEFRSKPRNVTYPAGGYIPFIGTSLVRDSQLLALRLFYSADFPVKNFILVVPRAAMQGSRVMRYEIRHLKDYSTNLILIACDQPPSVSEGWNAVFHALPGEPWGIYNARDTMWVPGSLSKAAQQFWPLVEKKEADVGLVGYSNLDRWPAEMAKFNVFMLTRVLVERFGYFDESYYPAFCEDDDFVMRLKLLQPPGVIKTLKNVFVLHGAPSSAQYISGTALGNEEGNKEEDSMSGLAKRKGQVNCNYFLRKWGCRSEQARKWVRALHDSCKHKTPFGKDLPVWYWRTTKQQRKQDKDIELRMPKNGTWQLWDLRTKSQIFDLPEHYGTWEGYRDPSSSCRLTGDLGRIYPANQKMANDRTPGPNCM